MSQHRNFFSTWDVVLLLPLIVALLVWLNLASSTFFAIAFVAFVELALLGFAVSLLSRRLPMPLKKAARVNCFRLDGTHSHHREHLETSAKWKLKSDILAILLIVLLTGNGLALAVHYYVIPMPLGLAALMSFQPDREAWKQEIESQHIASEYQSDYRNRTGASFREAAEATTELWRTWPLVVFGIIGWGIGAQVFLATMYRRALAEYSKGIACRAKIHAERDVTRLQQEFEPEFTGADVAGNASREGDRSPPRSHYSRPSRCAGG